MRQALFRRNKKVLGACGAALWLSACAPDLSANEAARCDEQQLCEQGEFCYRGFCLPQDIAPVAVDDGGLLTLLDDAGVADGSAVSLTDASVLLDGSASDAPPAQPADASAQLDASPPANNKPDAGPPANNRPDAGPPANRPDASVPDASVRADASTTCTNKECCDEAKRFSSDDDNEKKGKKCGCDNFLQVLACGLFSPVQPLPTPQVLP